MRKVYQRRLPEDPNKDYYYIIRETGVNTEPILVEYGFIDNDKDVLKLKNNLLEYVEGVVKALAEYTNTPYKKPGQQIENPGIYTVKKGDTLYSIAAKSNTTIAMLRQLNKLTSDILSIGQVLLLPTATNIPNNEKYEVYTVKAGDTLYSIAQNYRISVDELKKINNLVMNSLMIGQQLNVPTTNNIPSIPEEDNSINEYTTYTVTKGDSLWSISKRYGITVDDLIKLNNLTTINLKVGDELLVPLTDTGLITYMVKKGDSLWSIAKNNNTSVDAIKEANNLSSNLLSIGQTLIIPK